MRLVIYDAETRSTLNLRQVGSYIYLTHPSTDLWCVSYCTVIDGVRGPVSTWRPGDPVPTEILEAHRNPEALICAHNDAFERQLGQQILGPRYSWPVWPIERRRCTQAAALSRALPAGLDKIAEAFRLPVRKTKAGKAAMKKLATPRKPRKGEDPKAGPYWHDNPKLFATLIEYNKIDVEITCEIVRLIGFIPPAEQPVWRLDATINESGIHFDRNLLEAGLKIADEASEELAAKLADLTGGEITSAQQTKRILAWLAQHGCPLPNTQKATVAGTLARSDLAPEVRQLLELRADGAHASVDKLATLAHWLGPDNRIRYAYRYWGASPGRWSSVGCQLQNLRKPAVENVAAAIEAVQTGSLAYLQTQYQRPLEVVGDITRALVTAAPKHQLFIADLSGIESRGLAWLCNEQGKLDAWRMFDRTGNAEDEPYYAIGPSFNVQRLNDPKSIRKIGKTADLAFQYMGGLGAWRRLAPADDASSEEEIYARQRAWRSQHPNIEKFWRVSVRQAVNAIENPGERFTAARIAFVYEKPFLRLELPSGRSISYPFARVYQSEDADTFTFRDASGGRFEWYHVLKKGRGVFGGLIAENATQALCRDLFVAGMLRLEARGYHIVAHLHDEFVCEVPNNFGSLEEFIGLITTPPAWAPDFPLAAKGRVSDRFIEIAELKAAVVEDATIDNAGHDERDDRDDYPLDERVPPWVPPLVEQPAASLAPASEPAPSPLPEPTMAPSIEDYTDASQDGYGGANSGTGARDERPRGAPVTTYIYKTAAGRLHARVVRYQTPDGRKSFPTSRWADGHWVGGWPEKAVPYRLCELLAAPTTERWQPKVAKAA
jgi:DNA polymerase